jgi:phage gpG-like protein
VAITVTAHSDGDVFGDLERQLRRKAEAFAAVGRIMTREKDAIFQSEGQPRETWKKLGPMRVAQRGGREHPILRDSDALKDSYQPTEPGAGESEIAMRSGLNYAGTHQFGNPKGPRGEIPARPILYSEQAKTDMIDAFVDVILGDD